MTTLRIYDANNYLRRNFEKGASVQQVVPMANPAVNVWVFDGPNALERRRKLYPDYKVKRDRETPTINGAYEFIRAIREDLLPHCENTLTVIMPGWEADDIIAHLIEVYSGLSSVTTIELYSNDGDFLQLKGDNVPKLKIMDTIKLAELVQPKDIRLYKTLVGDSSDNIPGLKGFGDKAFASLSYSLIDKWEQYLVGVNDEDLVRVLADSLKPAQKDWFLKGGGDMLRLFWKVVGFMPVPGREVDAAMRVSKLDRDEYQRTCRQYMWGV